MAIQSSELRFHRPGSTSDTASNGGRMSSEAITTAVKNNIWGDVPEAERVEGSVKYRKQFLKIANAANIAFSNVRICYQCQSMGAKLLRIHPAWQNIRLSGTWRSRPEGVNQMATLTQAGAMVNSNSTMLCNQSSPFALTLIVTPITGVTFQTCLFDMAPPAGTLAMPITGGGDTTPSMFWSED